VITYVKSSYRPRICYDLQNKAIQSGLEISCTAISLAKKSKTITILGVYRPPNLKASWFNAFNDLLTETMKKGQIIIMGDLNADLLKSKVNPGKLLSQSLKLSDVKVPSKLPTRITGNSTTCLDIIAVSLGLVCSKYWQGDLLVSDHFPVCASLEVAPPLKIQPVLKRSFKKVNMDSLRDMISCIKVDQGSIDVAATSWNDQLTGLLDQVAPLKHFPRRIHRSPFASDVKDLIDYRNWLTRKLKKSGKANNSPGTPSDDGTSSDDITTLLDQIKVANKQIKSQIRRAAKVAGDMALSNSDNRQAWRFIRMATFTGGASITPTIDSASLSQYFSSLVYDGSCDPITIGEGCDNEDSFQLRPVSGTDVQVELVKIRACSATGPDGLFPFLFKEFADVISPHITLLFNQSISEHSFPNVWKIANIAPIWKGKGPKNDPSNYRSISILPIIARIFEKLIARQLNSYFDSKDLIPVEQFGFRKASDCESAIIAATNTWYKQIDQGNYVGVLLIDLSKAFDSVSHQKLLTDLFDVGCSLNSRQWFASYLSGRSQRVVQRTDVSDWALVNKGVPQGSGLSPSLFNLFVRKLPAACTPAEAFQFADDLTSSAAGKNLTDVTTALTHSYQNITDFCVDRNLTINVSKTQLIVFKAPFKKIAPDYELTLDGITLKPVDSVKLLGVHLDKHLTMATHIDKTVKKCHGLIGVLSRASVSLSHRLTRMAYIALIRSHLEYASAVVSAASKTHLSKLDTIQKAAVRIIAGAPRLAHSEPLRVDLNIPLLETRRQDHILRIVFNILEGKTHPALRDLFIEDSDGNISSDFKPRTVMGRRSFQSRGVKSFNSHLNVTTPIQP